MDIYSWELWYVRRTCHREEVVELQGKALYLLVSLPYDSHLRVGIDRFIPLSILFINPVILKLFFDGENTSNSCQ